jgi:hypothetical protein
MDSRWNTSSGRAPDGTYSKAEGARKVAQVMRRAEKPQGASAGGGVKFSIEDGNRAKSIDHDAMPK